MIELTEQQRESIEQGQAVRVQEHGRDYVLLRADVYARLNKAADIISTAVSAALAAEGVDHVVQRAGNLFSFAFTEDPPRNYDAVKAQQSFRYPPFFHAMLDGGV